MTRAEEMRKIQKEEQDKRHEKATRKHKRYATRIVNIHCKLAAKLCHNNAVVKIRKRYSPTWIAEILREMGFEVEEYGKAPKRMLKIKW